ncbi:polynucleotide adenylyltransferase PcnB [Salinispira pacifica]|uniref:Poly(A) polymerase n=1 Tax=Salinispira pacifica TaxID=1307761 RepID=V5WF23_9SPIO|nr:polynucleotide adenylyltransferase PcnB [Salinispira pacifica]AHC14235.1 Poly(A) polymerase [Salinispira pacifica]
MLVRYKTLENGKAVKQAEVYTKTEHHIRLSDVDHDAIKIIRRLEKAGHESYIVGGAVRDLLLGKRPKDFDIVTSAEPNHIRKLFRNSRIIGKRFRLVHIFFKDKKIIEVSTFRSADSKGFNNVFGEIEEDALRRDFSMNALYYHPIREQVVDFVKGYPDIKARRLKAVIPLGRIFEEDPVRIIRAIKYSEKTGLKPGFRLKRKMRSQAELLKGVSYSRLTEEIYKILGSGYARPIFQSLFDHNITEYILPGLDQFFRGRDQTHANNRKVFFEHLGTLDDIINKQRETPRSVMIQYLVRDFVMRIGPWKAQKRIHFPEVYSGIKDILKPMVPANKDVEDVVVTLMRERQEALGIPKKRSRRRRRKPSSRRSSG